MPGRRERLHHRRFGIRAETGLYEPTYRSTAYHPLVPTPTSLLGISPQSTAPSPDLLSSFLHKCIISLSVRVSAPVTPSGLHSSVKAPRTRENVLKLVCFSPVVAVYFPGQPESLGG